MPKTAAVIETPEIYRNYCGKREYASQGGWSSIPRELLDNILDHIAIRYRYRASMTCRAWYAAFQSAGTWRTFVYRDLVFTRRRFTIHSGWQPMIDHYRLRFLVNKCTRCWRSMVIEPVTLLFNLYEFLRVLTNFSEYYENEHDNPLVMLKSFEFDWSMKFRNDDPNQHDSVAYGTGGQVLKQLSHFLSHLHGLESLSLRHLLLDNDEAETFLSDLLNYFDRNLHVLCVRNLTKRPCQFMHVGLFLNLTKLVISPQHLNDEVVELIGGQRRLRHLVIIQDENTLGAEPASMGAWRRFGRAPGEQHQMRRDIQVHLRCQGRCTDGMLWQPGAPVVSIAYSNPCARLTEDDAQTIAEYYADSLEIYVQRGWQRRYRGKDFRERADSALISLIRTCPQLKLVGIRERLSTSTLLYAAHLCSFKNILLLTRRNALLKRSADWPYNESEWSREFYAWLTSNARDYGATCREVGKLLGRRSMPLTDNEYLHIFKRSDQIT